MNMYCYKICNYKLYHIMLRKFLKDSRLEVKTATIKVDSFCNQKQKKSKSLTLYKGKKKTMTKRY